MIVLIPADAQTESQQNTVPWRMSRAHERKNIVGENPKTSPTMNAILVENIQCCYKEVDVKLWLPFKFEEDQFSEGVSRRVCTTFIQFLACSLQRSISNEWASGSYIAPLLAQFWVYCLFLPDQCRFAPCPHRAQLSEHGGSVQHKQCPFQRAANAREQLQDSELNAVAFKLAWGPAAREPPRLSLSGALKPTS